MTAVTRIQTKLNNLLDCFAVVEKLANCHVANFFTKNIWNTMLPSEVLEELNNLQISYFPSMYLDHLSGKETLKNLPKLQSFLERSNKITLYNDSNCLTSLEELKFKLKKLGSECGTAPEIKEFMSDKKKHEVQEVVPIADSLSRLTDTKCVVDIGGGKGYLSTIFSVHSQVQVLGIDSSEVATVGAVKLEKKMKREKQVKNQPCLREVMHVSSTTQLSPLLKKHFGTEVDKAGMLGLHTCGNLASTCCRMFMKEEVPWFINVSCCYHLLDEQFDCHPFWSDLEVSGEECGFPLSQYLIEKGVRLGRNARMLAAHSMERLMRDGVNENAIESLFYRAVFQIIIERSRGHALVEGYVGKLFEKCNSFQEYARKGIDKLNLNIDVTDDEIEDLFRCCKEEKSKLRAFFLLRTHFAPLIESIILLDRLLYLLEQGIQEAHLVPLFKPELSPRSHAIIAWKQKYVNNIHQKPLQSEDLYPSLYIE